MRVHLPNLGPAQFDSSKNSPNLNVVVGVIVGGIVILMREGTFSKGRQKHASISRQAKSVWPLSIFSS